MFDVGVYRLPMAHPGDVSELEKKIAADEIDPKQIIAIIAQTEGVGYDRGYATLAFQVLLSEYLGISKQEVFDTIPMLMIGLTGGLMSPHYTVFTRKDVEGIETGEKRFAVGVANTPVLLPEDYGTVEQIRLVAEAVKVAMADAGIDSVEDVHCVEIKWPAMTPPRAADARSRGKAIVSEDLGLVTTLLKGASALGIAVAMGEVSLDQIKQEDICRNWSLYSNKASTSAGGEQVAVRVVLMGNSTKSKSKYVIGHGVMQDQLDVEGAKDALRNAGLRFDCMPSKEQSARIANIFVNAGADSVGAVRGKRHTIKTDFLAGYAGIQAKAVAHAIVASLVGDTMILASAGSEHQGPLGANLLAVIAEAE